MMDSLIKEAPTIAALVVIVLAFLKQLRTQNRLFVEAIRDVDARREKSAARTRRLIRRESAKVVVKVESCISGREAPAVHGQ